MELSVYGDLSCLFKTQEIESIRLHTESKTFWLKSSCFDILCNRKLGFGYTG